MCCCPEHPNINGQPGYSWDGKSIGTRPIHAPPLAEGDALIFDEPGRCGGIDAHSHHFRLVKNGRHYLLLVQHGGGAERIRLDCIAAMAMRAVSASGMDTHGRFWLLHTLYSLRRDATEAGAAATREIWRQAAAEKRIKTRKRRDRPYVKVWIEDARDKP
jgi:hypothetical protein